MTAAELIAQAAKRLSDAGVPEPELDAKILFLEAFHMDQVHFLMNRMRPLTEEQRAQQETYEVMIDRRSARVPLQQILGSQEFMGLTFRVTPDVLIPRQDTETLVEQVLQEQKDPDIRLLDLCTGSGCIAISLAVMGGYRDVMAADLSEAALKVAAENADHLLQERRKEGCRFTLRRGDLFEALKPGERFDVLTSNPRQQFLKGKWFHQVITGPRIQSLHPVINTVPGSQKKHRRPNPQLPDPVKQRQSVHIWHHNIQNRRIIRSCRQIMKSLHAVQTGVYGIAFFL